MTFRNTAALLRRADCVVMLTWSDWKTEPRSNRYHFATRLAEILPVLFVQPDAQKPGVNVEDTSIKNIRLVHITRTYGSAQTASIARVVNALGFRRPILWTYNAHFNDVVARTFSPLKIYHATEDYFAPASEQSDHLIIKLRDILAHTDLLIAVSEAVRDRYVDCGGYRGETVVLANGCDYRFWTDGLTEVGTDHQRIGRTAIYQGGINSRIDFDLLIELASALPHWDFEFCGRVANPGEPWARLQALPNVRYLGELTPEELRAVCRRSTVGLIPFKQEPYIDASMPLKAMEYVASGLPVVTVPIKALRAFPQLFTIACDGPSFASALERAIALRHDADATRERQAVAARYDYDERFEELLDRIDTITEPAARGFIRANVLILYDAEISYHAGMTEEHLRSFRTFSTHEILYAHATDGARCTFDLSMFDAIVLHYSIRVSTSTHLSREYAAALRAYGGLKLLFLPEDYEGTESARRWIEELGIHVVFTCVPPADIARIYPRARFPHVEFLPTLPGHAPLGLPQVFTKVQDDHLGADLTDRALGDAISSGASSYEAFVRGVDRIIAERLRVPSGVRVLSEVVATKDSVGISWLSVPGPHGFLRLPASDVESREDWPEQPLTLEAARDWGISPSVRPSLLLVIGLWRLLPLPVRERLHPVAMRALAAARVVKRRSARSTALNGGGSRRSSK